METLSDDNLHEGRFIGFYATQGWDEWDGFPLPSLHTIMGEQLVQGCYIVTWGRVELATVPYKTQNIPLHHLIPSHNIPHSASEPLSNAIVFFLIPGKVKVWWNLTSKKRSISTSEMFESTGGKEFDDPTVQLVEMTLLQFVRSMCKKLLHLTQFCHCKNNHK